MMITSYNLLHEPWLPVRWRSGDPPTEIGLRDALIRAHEVEELATDNPLETIALNRLLAALVASIFPEIASRKQWFHCWQISRFDTEQCDLYFTNYADHFDLLSKTRPFFSCTSTDTKEISPMTRLFHTAASGNNHSLFSHDLTSLPKPVSLSEAARAIVCTQAFAISGGNAKPFNFSDAPLIGKAFFWLRGQTDEKASLHKALLLNLSPTSNVWGDTEADFPIWERKQTDSLLAPQVRDVGGIRDLFTFQSRRLQVVLDGSDQAIGVYFNQGSKIDKLLFDDPHVAYVSGKNKLSPLQLSIGRALWRDSAAYMLTVSDKGAGGHAPRTFNWLSNNVENLNLKRQDAFAADVFSLVNDQGKIELWRQERAMIYPTIITDVDRWDTLNKLIINADRQAGKLEEATIAYAMRLQHHVPYGSKVDRKSLRGLVATVGTNGAYWVQVGSAFDSFLATISKVAIDELANVKTNWHSTIRNISREVLLDRTSSFRQDADLWQAQAEALQVLQFGKLKAKSTKTNHTVE